MEYAKVVGGRKLQGEVRLQGSKNAALPMIAAGVLCRGEVTITNCPDISDVRELLEALVHAGVKSRLKGGVLWMDATDAKPCNIDDEPAKKTRGGVLFLGSFLGRFGEAGIAYPGGCVIGKRPIDLHCAMLRCLSVEVEERPEGVFAKGHPRGAKVSFPYPSVGATENAILAAVCASGRTELLGAATEPEITELCRFLNKAGAVIFGIGTSHLVIDGVASLHGVTHRLSGDRIVAGTYLAGAVMTAGDVTLTGTGGVDMTGILEVLQATGAKVVVGNDFLRGMANSTIQGIPYLETAPYPGFPTDMQSQMLALLSLAEGNAKVCETIFESRFGVVPELRKLGADLTAEGKCVFVRGGTHLLGTTVQATDLRSGAALILAGLAAEGETKVHGVHYIKRGYEEICGTLRSLGADLIWVEDV